MSTFLFLVLKSIWLLSTCAEGYGFLGPGQWLVLNILDCDNANQYDFMFELSRKKINRTHDGFDLYMKLDREINNTYGVEIVAKKLVDGGYKYFQTFSDPNMCTFIKKYAKDNFERALATANIDPPDCPIPPGEVTINKFVFDYGKFVTDGVYGTFDSSVYLTYAGRRVACIRVLVNYDKENGKESGSDEDSED